MIIIFFNPDLRIIIYMMSVLYIFLNVYAIIFNDLNFYLKRKLKNIAALISCVERNNNLYV